MTTSCPPDSRCNTDAPGWMNGELPSVEDGVVTGRSATASFQIVVVGRPLLK